MRVGATGAAIATTRMGMQGAVAVGAVVGATSPCALDSTHATQGSLGIVEPECRWNAADRASGSAITEMGTCASRPDCSAMLPPGWLWSVALPAPSMVRAASTRPVARLHPRRRVSTFTQLLETETSVKNSRRCARPPNLANLSHMATLEIVHGRQGVRRDGRIEGCRRGGGAVRSRLSAPRTVRGGANIVPFPPVAQMEPSWPCS
jgi:hypothetical protein